MRQTKIIIQLVAEFFSTVFFFIECGGTKSNSNRHRMGWKLLKCHRFCDCIPLYWFAWLQECSSKPAIINWRRHFVHKREKRELTCWTMIKMIIIMRQVMLSAREMQRESILFHSPLTLVHSILSSGSRSILSSWRIVCIIWNFIMLQKVDVNQYPAIIHCFADTFFPTILVPRAILFCWLNSCLCIAFALFSCPRCRLCNKLQRIRVHNSRLYRKSSRGIIVVRRFNPSHAPEHDSSTAIVECSQIFYVFMNIGYKLNIKFATVLVECLKFC